MHETPACSVCGMGIEPARHEICDECLQPFHLNLRLDVATTSCGAAYVGAACGMNVYCDPCGEHLDAEAAVTWLARVG